MSNLPEFMESLTGWVVVTLSGAVAWLAKANRSDGKETRETLLSMSREQSDAMHATAAALNRNTDALKANTEVIRRVAGEVGQSPPPSSGQQ